MVITTTLSEQLSSPARPYGWQYRGGGDRTMQYFLYPQVNQIPFKFGQGSQYVEKRFPTGSAGL